MAVIAPTPPTKPTPPVPPTLTPAGTSAEATDPAAANLHPVKFSNSAADHTSASDTKKTESVDEKPQENSVQAKDTGKTDASKTVQQAPQESSLVNVNSDEGMQAQTLVDKMPMQQSKSSGFSYAPFIGILVIVAVVLVGLKLLKKNTKETPSIIDDLQQTDDALPKEGIDIAADENVITNTKPKKKFEVRI
ncbi:hypothetical protein [Anaerosinus massiliensis]|uniref:hypothetical protein n=1 Tax=Massilibacillus massiliensis TaxID=1806837 RepID=UPI000A8328C1|nr:hypothetical protein [Massilibacillus massiliensis]